VDHPAYPGLELDEDMRATRRAWRVQRIGWVLLALFLLAGLLGLLGGNGPLQQASVASADGRVLVTYPRFDRYVAPSQLEVRIEPAALPGGSVELALSRRWVDVFELYGISPTPDRERADGADIVYRFSTTPGQPLEIGFFGRPHHVGPLPGSLAVAGGERLSFSTFVLP